MSDTLHSGQTTVSGGDDIAAEDRFVSAWREGVAPPLTEFLPQVGDEGYLGTLERLVQIEIEQAWRKSSRDSSSPPQPLEEYLARFPVLRTPEAILRLARAEFLVRNELGSKPDPLAYVSRFPDYITPASASELLIAAEEAASARAKPPSSDDLGMLGDYKLLEQIGEGGMGVVYRALQPGANRVVALKVIRSSMTGSGESFRKKAESRFKNEIQAAAQLEHENIVPVYDVGNVGDLMYFAMRFVEGKSLNDLVKQGPIENRLAATYMAGTAKGVAEAHRRGILHRDLKPHNVMIDARSGRPMVADFGLAKVIDAEDQITKTGETIGTPSYMPPEQISDAANVDQRGDVYSLGATLYHLVAGRPPFQAANTLGTMRQVLYDEAAPPKRLNSAVDADLDTICLKCLQKEPGRRYQTAQEFVDDLERYLRGEPILARPIGRLERLNRWRRRNPLEAGLAGVAIVLAAVALAATTIGYQQTKAALDDSQRNLQLARSAVDELYTEVSEIDLQNQPGLQPLKQTLLRRALAYYQRFLEANQGDHQLSAELAASHARVGAITEEVESTKSALPHFQKAAEIQRELLAKSPKDAALKEGLSDSLNSIGRVEQRLQNYSRAQKAYDESRALRKELVSAAPGEREYQRKLANVVMNSGLLKVRSQQLDEASRDYTAAQQIRRTLLDATVDEAVARDFARGAFNQGTLEQDRDQLASAAAHFESSVTWFRRLTSEHPESLAYRFELAVASVLQADVLATQNDVAKAQEAYAFGREQLQQLANENPQVLAYRERLGTAAIGAAQLQLRLVLERQPPAAAESSAQLEGAALFLEGGVTALTAVIAQEPLRVGPRHDLAVALQLLGEVKRLQGDDAAAIQAWRRGLAALEPVKAEFAKNPDCAAQWNLLEECLKSSMP